MKETLIRNAVIVTQNSKREVFKGWLHLIDNRIAGMGRGDRVRRSAQNAKVIDADGLYLLPGFIQAHLHLCQTLFRNRADDLELLDWLSDRIWPFEASHTHETLQTSALIGIHELLQSGTTSILDMGTVRHTEAIIEAARTSGIRANIGKCLMDRTPSNPKYLSEKTADALKEAESLFLKYNGSENDRIRISFAPRFALSCTEELMRSVAKLAKKYGAVIHTHANENRKELIAIKKATGLDNMKYLEKVGITREHLVLAHCVWIKDSERKIIRERKNHVVHCPSSNLKLASGIAPIPLYLKEKINVSLGADGAPCNNTLNAFQEMRLAALIQKPSHGPHAMPAPDVLDLATLGGARALKWADEIGSIEVGKKADFTLLNLSRVENRVGAHGTTDLKEIASAVVYSGQPQCVEQTWVDGRCVAKKGKVLTINERALEKRAVKAEKIIRERRRSLSN